MKVIKFQVITINLIYTSTKNMYVNMCVILCGSSLRCDNSSTVPRRQCHHHCTECARSAPRSRSLVQFPRTTIHRQAKIPSPFDRDTARTRPHLSFFLTFFCSFFLVVPQVLHLNPNLVLHLVHQLCLDFFFSLCLKLV